MSFPLLFIALLAILTAWYLICRETLKKCERINAASLDIFDKALAYLDLARDQYDQSNAKMQRLINEIRGIAEDAEDDRGEQWN